MLIFNTPFRKFAEGGVLFFHYLLFSRLERKLAVFNVYRYGFAGEYVPRKNFVGKSVLDTLLHHPFQRTRAVHIVVALFDELFHSLFGNFQLNVSLQQSL